MSLSPQVCKKSYKVKIPTLGDNCEFWLITVTDEQSITNPDKDHAYLTDSGKLYIYNGKTLIQVNCDICFTQEERDKLEGIEEGANKYVLPVASSTELGGVLLGYTQDGRNYPVLKDEDGRIYVQVPWVEYSLPIAKADTLGGIKTGYEQNGRFYPVLVDVDGNAYVNVPWTDTDTKYNVVSDTENGLAPMLPSDENASKRFLNGDGEWVVGTDNSINGVTQIGGSFSGETSDCGVQILEIQGKTTQQTTNGYQLFDQSKLPTKSQGGATVTNNGDGSFTVSGSGELTENFSQNIYYSKEETLNLLKQGTLKANGLGNISPNIIFGLRNKNTGTFVSGKSVNKNTNSCQITQNDLDTLGDEIVLSISMYTAQGTQIVSGTIKPMIYIDGTGEFEPFTGGKPAPNPDYEMEIKNVKIKNIHSTGKNLIKFPYMVGGIGSKNTVNGIEYEVMPDKGVKVSGTSTGNVFINLCTVDFGNIGFTGTTSLSKNGYIASIKGADNVAINYDSTNNITFIFIQPENTVNTIVYPMVEKSDVRTEWEAPTGYNTIETNLTLAQDDVYNNNQITRARKQVVFDGSSDEGWLINENLNGFTRFTIIFDDFKSNTPFKCNRFECDLWGVGVNTEQNKIWYYDDNIIRLTISDEYTSGTLEGFKSWLQTRPVIVEYELATPTTEELKVPTIPSYYPYTEVSTDSEVEPEITFRPLPFTTCLVGEATEEESGYMPPLSGNSNEFLNGNGEWSVPSGYTLPTASASTLGGVKIGENITISSGTISIDKEDVTGALGYTPPTTNTTYSVATTSKDGLMSSADKAKVDNLRRIYKGTSDSAPSGWVDGDIYVQYEE